ncbi:MAG: AMP-binding protein [Bacteroidota bacterium]
MIIKSANFQLKLEEFLKDKSSSYFTNKTEKSVFQLIDDWINGSKAFTFHTSGSTGKPQKIQITRDRIIYSTRSTFDFIDPKNEIKNTLLCINPQFIGGAMVVFRALIMNLDLYIIDPTKNIVEIIPDNDKIDLVSMVPMQFQAMNNESLDQFKTVLIGGAPLGVLQDCNSKSDIYATYGMTETVSHIALRSISDVEYRTTGDTKVRLNENGCLQFKGTITNHSWLSTNDLGVVASSTRFEWIGRKDFIINSGGIKLNPEKIEGKLTRILNDRFIISSLPDRLLGEKVILIIEGKPEEKLDFSSLEKYEVPKMVFKNIKIEKTASDKVDRRKTREKLLNSLKWF